MTAPWAEARVEAELDWGNIDDELERRLERSVAVATRKCQRHFTELQRHATRQASQITRDFDAEFNSIVRNAKTTVARINRSLEGIDNVSAVVDVQQTGATVKDIRATASALRRLQKDAGHIQSRIDIEINSIEKVRELATALRALPRRHQVDIDVDRRGSVGKATRSISGLLGGLGGLAGGVLSATGTFLKFTSIAGLAAVALGALVPIIGALGSGLVAVGGAAGVVAVGGLFALGAAAGALATAFSGVGEAAQSMFDPDKAAEFEEALAKLTPAAQSALRSFQRLGKAYADIVKTPVQETFFAGLAPKIDQLQRLLPQVRDSLVDVAQGFNDGANGALRMINSTAGLSMVRSLLADAGNMGANFGAAIFGVVPGFLALGSAATSVLSPMTDGIGGIARGWSETMLAMQQSGELQQKMQGWIDGARQFGAVLAQVGSIIGGVFAAAKAAGDGNPMAGMLASLTKVSEWVNGPGQQALTSFFQASSQAMGAIMPVLLSIAGVIGTTVAPMIAELATALGPTLQVVVGALGQGLAALQPAIAPVSAALSAIGSALAPVLPILGQVIAQFAQLAGPIIGSLAAALGPILQALGGALISVMQALQPAIAPIQQIFQALSPILAQVAQVIGSVLAGAISALMPIVQVLSDVLTQWWAALSPIIPMIGEALTGAIQAVAPFIAQLAEMLGQALGQAIQLIAPLIPQIVDAFMQLLNAVLPLVPILLQLAMTCLQPIIGLLPSLISIITSLLPIIVQLAGLFSTLVTAVMPIVQILAQVIGLFVRLLGAIIGFVAQALAAIVGWVASIIAAFVGMVTSVVSTVQGWVSQVVGFFGELASSALAKAQELWNLVSNAFSTGVSKAVDFVKELPGKIGSALSGAGRWLVDTGKKVIQGLIDGIASMAGSLINALINLLPGPLQGAARSALGLFMGGWVPPALAGGGMLSWLAGGGAGRKGAAGSAQVAPGSFIVNARQTARNLPLLKRLAPKGRVLTGPGSTTSDSITGMWRGRATAMVSRGEYHVPPEQAAGIMPLLWAINTGRQLGEMLAAGGLLPAFAPGGMVPAQLRDLARQAVQSAYTWGGWGNGWNTDCSGLTSSLANMATGRSRAPGVGERTATGGMAGFLRARGFAEGRGPDGSLRIGWSGTHAGAQLPTGEFVEHTGPQGSPAKFGADAKDPAALGNMMHLPMGGDTDSGALGGDKLGGSGSTGSLGTASGGSTSYGNAGGSSSVSSAGDAKRSGLTPVWVENWPSTLGGQSGAVPSPSGTPELGAAGTAGTTSTAPAAGSPGEDTIELVQQSDGTWKAKDPAWDHLVQRESGGRADIVQQIQDANSGGNEASGLFQIAKGTWSGAGGTQYAPTAGEATPQEQALIAAKIFKRDGGSPWGAGLAGRENESELRAGITKVPAVPTTPEGNVPVEIANQPNQPATNQPATPDTPAPAATANQEATPAAAETQLPELSGAPSAIGGNATAYIVENLFAGVPELEQYSQAAGGVANAAVAGQLGSALGLAGMDFEPRALAAFNQYMGDNASEEKTIAAAVKKALTEAIAAGFGSITVNITGDNVDGRKVAAEADAERRRKMRRFTTT